MLVDEKTAVLRKLLRGEFNMLSLDELQMPHEPNIYVYAVLPDECTIFKSAV
jgi:hypothetical protein